MITYDPRGMDWPEYSKLMAELFSANNVGFVPEEQWREWVDGLNGLGNFGQSGVPDSRLFNTWREWAEQMVGIMSLDTL